MLRKVGKFPPKADQPAAGTVHSVQQFTVKKLFLCLACAISLILSFSAANTWILPWFGFIPLFIALKDKTKSPAFLFSYFTGVIFWAGTIYWLIHVTLAGTIVLILYLALYFGLFGLIITTHHSPLTTFDLLFIPSLWVILEYARGHLLTGFPWAVLGYSQCLNLPAIQIADITGCWGISFLIMMVNVAVYSFITFRPSLTAGIKKYSLVVLCLSAAFVYGYYKLGNSPLTAHHSQIRVSVIQGNIAQELKWDPRARDYIVNKYLNLSRAAARDRPDLIVWPEAALPVILETEPSFFGKARGFVQDANVPLLLGAVTSDGNYYFNSAILISPDAASLTKYNKLHLVPFGEYIPLKKFLPFLEVVVPIGDINKGGEYTIFKVATRHSPLATRHSPLTSQSTGIISRFATLICFEDLFPELSREFTKRGADFLVNITNDAWYKKTTAAQQHFQASVFRAVENRLPLVRAANTGVSGFISSSGKIISLVGSPEGETLFVDGYKTEEVNVLKKKLSFYTRYGDIFVIFCFLIALYGICGPLRKEKI